MCNQTTPWSEGTLCRERQKIERLFSVKFKCMCFGKSLHITTRGVDILTNGQQNLDAKRMEGSCNMTSSDKKFNPDSHSTISLVVNPLSIR